MIKSDRRQISIDKCPFLHYQRCPFSLASAHFQVREVPLTDKWLLLLWHVLLFVLFYSDEPTFPLSKTCAPYLKQLRFTFYRVACSLHSLALINNNWCNYVTNQISFQFFMMRLCLNPIRIICSSFRDLIGRNGTSHIIFLLLPYLACSQINLQTS